MTFLCLSACLSSSSLSPTQSFSSLLSLSLTPSFHSVWSTTPHRHQPTLQCECVTTLPAMASATATIRNPPPPQQPPPARSPAFRPPLIYCSTLAFVEVQENSLPAAHTHSSGALACCWTHSLTRNHSQNSGPLCWWTYAVFCSYTLLGRPQGCHRCVEPQRSEEIPAPSRRPGPHGRPRRSGSPPRGAAPA